MAKKKEPTINELYDALDKLGFKYETSEAFEGLEVVNFLVSPADEEEEPQRLKITELQGAALDRAVAKCEVGDAINEIDDPHFYSTDWALGGPIIESEKVTLEWTGEDWMAYIFHDREFFGPTPLVAAMRCYVESKLGDEVEVPNKYIKSEVK